MAAKFIRVAETVLLDVSVEIDGERRAFVSGPGSAAFADTLINWAHGADYFSTEFDIETGELLLEGCNRYSTEPSGGFHVTFRSATKTYLKDSSFAPSRRRGLCH